MEGLSALARLRRQGAELILVDGGSSDVTSATRFGQAVALANVYLPLENGRSTRHTWAENKEIQGLP